MNRKQLLICLVLGAVVSAFPLILTSLPGTSPTLDKMQQASSLLLLPSLPLSIALSQGNIHDSNLWIMGLFDCVFYTALFYLLTRWFAKRRSTSAKDSIKLQAIVAVILLGGISAHAQEPETEMFQNAQRLYASGKLAEAEKKFTEITRDHPANIAAQMYLGQTLFKEEKYAAAIVPYERVRALEKTGTQLSLTQQRILGDQLAMAFGLSGRSSDAKALLQESVRTDPGYPLSYYNLACVSADEDDKAGVLKNLSLAFQHKGQVLPGEQMPNPASDPSFKKYAQDNDFRELLNRLKRHS